MSTLESIKGIGPKMKEKLNRNSIYDSFDIIDCYPKRYEIYYLQELSDAVDNERCTLKGKVISQPLVSFIRKNFTRLSFKIEIENRVFTVSIFNREYLSKILDVGTIIVVTGKIERLKQSITATTLKLEKNFTNHIESIYGLEGITDLSFNKIVNESIKEYGYLVKDDLPKSLLEKYKLLNKNELLEIVHNPKNDFDLKQIDRRIKYEELFKFQFKMQYLKLKTKSRKFESKKYNLKLVKDFINSLPFELTNDQKRATNEILKDIKSPYTMNRLLQGDTGSGKTVIAAIAAFSSITAGYQVALMAPTEILAKQHFKSFSSMFKDFAVEIVFLSGKLLKEERNIALKSIAENKEVIVIGTHALFSDDVSYNKLGLVITDEQHRFGVNQRKKLREKGFSPDILYMSATPIPRTLAISIFGDMDISTIKEKPANRKAITTKLFSSKELDLVYHFISDTLSKNQQVYIVTPLILESESLDLNNAQKVYSDIRNYFKDYQVGLLHSKIKTEDKDKVMEMFIKNEINILVSTTVIEVGVDNSNATLMIILDSERFGLSQLHQLRGRVGRSNLESYCLLVHNETENSKERLEILEKTEDGFLLSEEDLRLRGPGDFFGFRQTGDIKFSKASIIDDIKILEIAREDVLKILTKKENYYDPSYTKIFKYLKKALRKDNLD